MNLRKRKIMYTEELHNFNDSDKESEVFYNLVQLYIEIVSAADTSEED